VPDTALAEKEALRRQLLGRFPLFSGLPAERLAALLDEAQLLQAPAGSVLFDAKQPCRGFPLVLEGSIRVAKRAPNGREILLYRAASSRAAACSANPTTPPRASPKPTSPSSACRRRCSTS
jgi:hypothetical protein